MQAAATFDSTISDDEYYGLVPVAAVHARLTDELLRDWAALEPAIRKLANEPERINWGHVGSVQHAISELHDLAVFLNVIPEE